MRLRLLPHFTFNVGEKRIPESCHPNWLPLSRPTCGWGMWQAATAGPERFVMGAFCQEVPVGFIISVATKDKHIDAQDGHLWGIYIRASEQNQGIGRKLVEMAHADWVSKGGHSMTVGVLAANVPAIRFYERLGATLVKRGIYDWGGFKIPDCIYIWQNLAKIAKI